MDFASNSRLVKADKDHHCSSCHKPIRAGTCYTCAPTRIGSRERCFCSQEHANCYAAAVNLGVQELGAEPSDVVACSDRGIYLFAVVLIKGAPHLYVKSSAAICGLSINGRILAMEEWDTPIPLKDGRTDVTDRSGRTVFEFDTRIK